MSGQSLRRVTDTDRHSYGYSYSDGVGDTDSDTYTDANPNNDSHSYCNNTSRYSDAHREGHSDSKTSSDAATKTMTGKSAR